MATRMIKSGPSLIDCITPPNELLDVRAIDKGFRFKFRDKTLPSWFAKLARRLDFAMQDDAPGRLRGPRLVSLIDDRHSSPVTYRSNRWQ